MPGRSNRIDDDTGSSDRYLKPTEARADASNAGEGTAPVSPTKPHARISGATVISNAPSVARDSAWHRCRSENSRGSTLTGPDAAWALIQLMSLPAL